MADTADLDRLSASLDELEALLRTTQPRGHDPMSNFEEDPVGNLHERLSQIEQMNQQHAHAAQLDNFARTVSSQVADFKKDCDDYDDAFRHVMEGRMADLKALGMSEADAIKVIDAEAGFVAEQAMRAGKNPGEALYTLAKNRGFQGQGHRGRKHDADDDTDTGGSHENYSRQAGGDDELAAALREKFGR